MEFLKKRPVAVILAVIIVAGSTLLSVNIKLGNACQRVTDGFYSGVTYAGYEHKSIQSQLKNISGAAEGLVSLASNYNIATDDVVAHHQDLESSIKNGDVSDIYDRYTVLSADCDSLVSKLNSANLSQRDASGVTQYASTLSGARNVIESSGYNDAVRDFMRDTYNAFPANVLAGVSGVDAPELFE